MKFEDFDKLVPKITNLPLPGQDSHYKMAPLRRLQEIEAIDISERKPRRAGVLSLFYPDVENDVRLLLILRNTYKGVHSDQVGFPGGKVEKNDPDIQFTALRETREEVGLDSGKISVIKKLTELYIPPSNFIVQPFLGVTRLTPVFIPDAVEVKATIEVKLTDFLDDSSVVVRKLNTSYARDIEVPAFRLNGYTVWGATAMMLSEVKELIKTVI